MRKASIHNLIRGALRDLYAQVLAEPIPQHWVDMLDRLAAQDAKNRQARAKQAPEFG